MKKILIFIFAATLLVACDDDKASGVYVFEIDWPSRDFIEFGTAKEYEIIRSGYKDFTVSAPGGWTVEVGAEKVSVTAPGFGAAEVETAGKVVLSSDESGVTFSVSMDVYTGIVAGFESVPQGLLAVDPKGSNFYEDEWNGDIYTGYTDPDSGLTFSVNPSDYGYNFYNGGTFFSTWNRDRDPEKDGVWENQCTVNYADPDTGLGGHGGSKVFAVVHYDAWQRVPTTISFGENVTRVIDHIWVMNTFYTSYVIENGNYLSDPAVVSETNGYLLVRATGYDVAGAKTSSADFYLADYRTAGSPGLLREWARFDLSPLGMVNRVEFTMDGSDSDPDYGLSTPAYFCFDDVAIRY